MQTGYNSKRRQRALVKFVWQAKALGADKRISRAPGKDYTNCESGSVLWVVAHTATTY